MMASLGSFPEWTSAYFRAQLVDEDRVVVPGSTIASVRFSLLNLSVKAGSPLVYAVVNGHDYELVWEDGSAVSPDAGVTIDEEGWIEIRLTPEDATLTKRMETQRLILYLTWPDGGGLAVQYERTITDITGIPDA